MLQTKILSSHPSSWFHTICFKLFTFCLLSNQSSTWNIIIQNYLQLNTRTIWTKFLRLLLTEMFLQEIVDTWIDNAWHCTFKVLSKTIHALCAQKSICSNFVHLELGFARYGWHLLTPLQSPTNWILAEGF